MMQQLGHTDPAFTLRVYAHTMRRSEEERERLRALVQRHVWAGMGSETPRGPPTPARPIPEQQKARFSRAFVHRGARI